MPYENCILQIQRFDYGREVIRISVHVISYGRLTGSPMPAPVNRNTAITIVDEEHHLAVPSVGVQRPTVREGYDRAFAPVFVVNRRTILHLNRAHVIFS
jgi:hypothetical protein